MKKSEILRQAAGYLQRKDATFLCHAIGMTAGDGDRKRQLKSRVSRLLDHFSTLQGWLLSKKHITEKQFTSSYYCGTRAGKKIRQTRINWALSMAAEYEAIGQ